MKIEQFKGYLVPVPPPGKGGRNWVFIKLITDEGIEGVGECTLHGTHRQLLLNLAKPFGNFRSDIAFSHS